MRPRRAPGLGSGPCTRSGPYPAPRSPRCCGGGDAARPPVGRPRLRPLASGRRPNSARSARPSARRPEATVSRAGKGPRAHAAAGPTVTRALSALLSSGQIGQATYKKDYAIYTAAKRSLGLLSGTRRAELGAVLANVQAIAAAGLLSASRLAAVFLTLERNR